MTLLLQNSILRISDDKTLQLIELYQQEECLWNTHLEDYRNREKRTKAAERIAKTLDIKHFESKHVMIKFKNLRNSYCQELKKIANSVNSRLGDDAVEGYKPRVFWFSRLDSFLRPHLQPARSSGLKFPHQEESVKRDDEIEEWVQMTNPEDVLLPDSSPEFSCTEDDVPKIENSRKRKISSCSRSGKRLKDEQVVISQTLKDISTQLHIIMSQNEDYFDNFGKYIASLLRTLPHDKALMLQPRIVSLITSVDIGNHEGHISQSDESIHLGE